MCGIFATLGKSQHSLETLKSASKKGSRRGPEFSIFKQYDNLPVTLGFHRLAINGINDNSNQPLNIGNVSLICNGEIYNYCELYEEMNIKPTTDSDCEVIIHIYNKYGIDGIMSMIDGVFAFVLIDQTLKKAFVARDPYGVRPLFKLTSGFGYYAFASEMKQLTDLYSDKVDTLEQFTPGTYNIYDINHVTKELQVKKYSSFPFMSRMEIPYPSEYTIYKYIGQIAFRLKNAVDKRVQTTDRPIACLLSGGLDSSLITALVAQHYPDRSKLETYSIGLEGSEDLKYAKMVAEYLGTNHTSIVVSEQEFLDAIPEVIYAIESYDTTTVRASVGNFLVAKYISQHSEAKVVFNGDGSDELSGGYLYFHNCPTSREFDLECKRLLENIHYFDVLRSDRCISYHGLEARTPFLDRSLVEHYLTIPSEIRNHVKCKSCEKYIIRSTFANKKILPDEVLWRTKEAFSDGVSSLKKSWYETIQDNLPVISDLENHINSDLINPPKTPEQKYYRYLFEKNYSGLGSVIPYFWMPKFVNAQDSSARTLNIYSNLVKK